MTDAHAKQYYNDAGSETQANSGQIGSYVGMEAGPAALSNGPAVEPPAAQPGLSAPIGQDKRRGSS